MSEDQMNVARTRTRLSASRRALFAGEQEGRDKQRGHATYNIQRPEIPPKIQQLYQWPFLLPLCLCSNHSSLSNPFLRCLGVMLSQKRIQPFFLLWFGSLATNLSSTSTSASFSISNDSLGFPKYVDSKETTSSLSLAASSPASASSGGSLSIAWYATGDPAILAIGVGKEMRRSWQGPLQSGTGFGCHAVVDKRAKRSQGEIYQKDGPGKPTGGDTVREWRLSRSFGRVPQENVTAFAWIAAASTLTTTQKRAQAGS